MGKTKNHFKKVGDIKRTFLARMGTVKDRNGMELMEAKEIKKRWQKYTEEQYKKKFLMTGITTVVPSLTYSQTFRSVKSSGP